MKILVKNTTIETKEIADIVELSGSYESGFKIIMIDGPAHVFGEKHSYDEFSFKIREANDYWRKLRLAVTEQWQKDKTDIPTFK